MWAPPQQNTCTLEASLQSAGNTQECFIRFPGGILSAKYGFLFPEDIIPGSYNVCFDNKKTHPVTIEELSAMAVKKGLGGYDTIIVLGGKHYVNMVKTVFFATEVYAPLSGYKGIGYMMKALKEAIIKGVPL